MSIPDQSYIFCLIPSWLLIHKRDSNENIPYIERTRRIRSQVVIKLVHARGHPSSMYDYHSSVALIKIEIRLGADESLRNV
jgi:hypothetical protein